ncbi:MAG: MotA/TolQ/ExbB proton channel family protein [Dysgonamonadaceae bacterium]|jgi:biopolymer transport protein ExbB|nr:MotA/TolQ/ExbB proton channel family protein [Dysgonamonadaceae bacterium]
MKRILILLLLVILIINVFPFIGWAQELNNIADNTVNENTIHQAIKIKFIEGSAFFMSFIAFSLIVGLAFCLERIIYLNLSQINTQKLLLKVENKLDTGDLESAKEITRSNRGPVASICYQALSRAEENIDIIEKSIISYGSVQAGLLEKNLSWITLFIAVAPSLGFLGTVIGMIKSFDNIQLYGDINPAIVAGGMKVALITTVGGLIVALILQFFYNYILTKIEEIVNQMENDSIAILDIVIKYKKNYQ